MHVPVKHKDSTGATQHADKHGKSADISPFFVSDKMHLCMQSSTTGAQRAVLNALSPVNPEDIIADCSWFQVNTHTSSNAILPLICLAD